MSGAQFDVIMYGATDERIQIYENNPDIILTGIMGVCRWVEETDRDATPDGDFMWADDGNYDSIKTATFKISDIWTDMEQRKYFIYESTNYRQITFLIPLIPLLTALGISFLICMLVPVFVWLCLEKKETMVVNASMQTFPIEK